MCSITLRFNRKTNYCMYFKCITTISNQNMACCKIPSCSPANIYSTSPIPPAPLSINICCLKSLQLSNRSSQRIFECFEGTVSCGEVRTPLSSAIELYTYVRKLQGGRRERKASIGAPRRLLCFFAHGFKICFYLR